MYCSKCGSQIVDSADVCLSCGTLIKKDSANNDAYVLYAVFGFVFAFISLLFFPPVFGGFAIWFGFIIKNKGNSTLGYVLIGIASALMVMGMIIGALIGI